MATQQKAVDFTSKSGEEARLVHGVPVLHVRIPIDPAEAASQDDTFTLKSTDGKYQVQQTIKDDKVPGDAYVDLIFENLKASLKYTLEVNPGAQGSPYKIFEDVPYQDLVDYYSLLEPGDDLEPPPAQQSQSQSAGSTNWDDEGTGGSAYGGDPQDSDTAMEDILMAETPVTDIAVLDQIRKGTYVADWGGSRSKLLD
jgi:hypothetical protein